MPTPLQVLEALIVDAQGVTSLAAKLTALTPQRTCTPQAISQWRRGLREGTGSIPEERCEPLETLSGGRHRVEDMRPDLQWQRDPKTGRVIGRAVMRAVVPTARARRRARG